METITQREMRNNSGEILRRVAAGESFLVTNNGEPAAVLSPVRRSRREALVAAGRLRVGRGLDLSLLPDPVVAPGPSTDELISDVRDEGDV